MSTLSLAALLILVLYLPSAYPPERFIDQLHIEDRLTVETWGRDSAVRILSRMLEFQATTKEVSPIPSVASAANSSPLDLAAAKQMSDVTTRLFHNAYFQSIDTLLALATYRLSALIEWLPFMVAFMLAAVIDGFLARVVKAKEFRRHNPELHAVYVCAAILMACATVVAFVLPITLPPLLFSIVPAGFGFFASRAIAHFHYRG